MVSNKQKGDKHELEVAKILEKEDLLVNKSPRTMKRIWTPKGMMYVSQANDYFGLFDIVCKSANPNLTSWIQVKTNPTDVSSSKPEIKEFSKKYCNDDFESVEIWLRVARKGFVIYVLDEDLLWTKFYINLKGEFVDPFLIKSVIKK